MREKMRFPLPRLSESMLVIVAIISSNEKPVLRESIRYVRRNLDIARFVRDILP